MNQKVFIPVTDEILYEHPELITSPLRPYLADNPCFHWLATIDMVGPSGAPVGEKLRFDHTVVLDDAALDGNAARQPGYHTGSSPA